MCFSCINRIFRIIFLGCGKILPMKSYVKRHLLRIISAFPGIITLLIVISSCGAMPVDSNGEILILRFTDGGFDTNYKKIYAVWMEDYSSSAPVVTPAFFKNLFICKGVKNQPFASGTAIPFWENNRRNIDTNIDAVTGNTIQTGNFDIPIPTEGLPDKFSVYFEIDHSFDENYWFGDQPAILYRVNVDRTNGQSPFGKEFIGWAPNENTNEASDSANKITGWTDVAEGSFQNTTGYILYQSDGTTLDSARATKLVADLSVVIE